MTHHQLNGIPETMLIPLWARAVEVEQDEPIIIDKKASEMLSRIDYDFDKFAKSKLSQIGVCVRTRILDTAAAAFLAQHDDAVVINLGAGLDTRYERLSPVNATWYDLDVPEGIRLRKKFFNESENNRFVAASMFESDWMEAIEVEGRPVLFIAEGIFMYFEEPEIRSLLASLADRFPGAEMLFEMLAPILVGRAKKHDAVGTLVDAPDFKWSLMDARDVENFHPNIEFVEQWNLFDHYGNRAPFARFVASLPFIKPRMAQRIVHLNFI